MCQGNCPTLKFDIVLSQLGQFKEHMAQISTITKWMSRMESHVTTADGGLAPLDSQRWNRISAPSLHVCAKVKQMLPLPQMFPARQDHGPRSSDDNKNTRRRLDTL